jgi:hypothetical protein
MGFWRLLYAFAGWDYTKDLWCPNQRQRKFELCKQIEATDMKKFLKKKKKVRFEDEDVFWKNVKKGEYRRLVDTLNDPPPSPIDPPPLVRQNGFFKGDDDAFINELKTKVLNRQKITRKKKKKH